MTVRDANFVDIPSMARVFENAYRRSIYAGKATLDPEAVKPFLARSIQRHGHTNIGGSLVMVSEKDGAVEGFMIGYLDSVYPCLKELMATDLLFLFSERADGRDAREMIKRLIAWADSNPKVVEVHLGVTDAIGDWQRTAKLYERLGLEQCGAMFTKRFQR